MLIRRRANGARATQVALLSDACVRIVRRARGGLATICPDDCAHHVRHALIFASLLGAAALALHSCSMHASVTTDGRGNLVEVSSIRLESSLARVAVAMLVAGGQVALELRWLRSLSGAGGDAVDQVGG
jgi:hypothetical protein